MTGSEEEVERVARAIFDQQNRVSVYPNRWESDPEHWRGMARAAVAALKGGEEGGEAPPPRKEYPDFRKIYRED